MTFCGFYFICMVVYAGGAYMSISHAANKENEDITLGLMLCAVVVGLLPIVNTIFALVSWGYWISENHQRVLFKGKDKE